jgi:hypothetical protein
MDTLLLIVGCAIFITLGVLHAGLLLFSNKFEPKDAELLGRLQTSTTRLSRASNMWRGIQGFHLSHSLGLVVYGWFFITLALENNSYLKASAPMTVGLLAVPAVYAYLAHRYWYQVPRNCSLLALGLLLAYTVLR